MVRKEASFKHKENNNESSMNSKFYYEKEKDRSSVDNKNGKRSNEATYETRKKKNKTYGVS